MKIAIVAEPYVPVPPDTYGGIEQIVYYLIKGLKETGHTPILLAPGSSNVDCQLIPTVEEAIYFPRNQNDLRHHKALVSRASRKTEKILRALAPEVDIIHSHGFDLKNFVNMPNLTTLHNPIQFNQIQYYKKRKDLFYASVSKNFQDSFPGLRYAGVVYNGEDPDSFPIINNPDDYVCFLGRFDRDKSPHLAIQLALAYGIKIKIAGKIDQQGENYFQDEIAKYLNHPLVDFLGELGFNDKLELIGHAKANLHPTGFREPFGLTVIEAAYCGTPSLAISRGAMPELIEHGRSGVLVEDFVEGYHHLQECFALDRDYVSLRARQLFSYKSMTQKYINVYEQVINEIPNPIYSPHYLKRFINIFKSNNY